MLTYALEKNGSSSLYTQLYDCIRRDILSGALPPRQKLPSKRALAQHLEVSVITVKNAYEQLGGGGVYLHRGEKGVLRQPRGAAPASGGPAAADSGKTGGAGVSGPGHRVSGPVLLPLHRVVPAHAPDHPGGGHGASPAAPSNGALALRRPSPPTCASSGAWTWTRSRSSSARERSCYTP